MFMLLWFNSRSVSWIVDVTALYRSGKNTSPRDVSDLLVATKKNNLNLDFSHSNYTQGSLTSITQIFLNTKLH